MTRWTWVLGFLLPLCLALPTASPDPTMSFPASQGALRIRIVGLPSSQGVVRIGLYRSKETYTTRTGSFRKVVLPIDGQTCEWVVEDLPAGDYAAMFYHDQNANHRLDRGLLGIPVEPFGFSNNAKPRLGPPAYERVRFTVGTGLTTIDILTQAS